MSSRLALSLLAAAHLAVASAVANEPILRKSDVIALVGGEEMVVLDEHGFLELLLMRAVPELQLTFRSLAWEGDTVFEQHRDLNYPTLEQQLEKIGATVVITQFGQAESFAGPEKVQEFIAAHEKLMDRLSAGGKRRLVVLAPVPFDGLWLQEHYVRNEALAAYIKALATSARKHQWLYLDPFAHRRGPLDAPFTRDGIHITKAGHRDLANTLGAALHAAAGEAHRVLGTGLSRPESELHQLLAVIQQKNRLWFHYSRPQNWAFLAGDRTNQPSSRDHVDPEKRWFPPELERFAPLIAAKEEEIRTLAAKLSQP
jgi:hypothetical protein